MNLHTPRPHRTEDEILAAEAARVRANRPAGYERRRVRTDATQTRWLCHDLDCTADTLKKIRSELSHAEAGLITGEAALAGIAGALCLNRIMSEKVEG